MCYPSKIESIACNLILLSLIGCQPKGFEINPLTKAMTLKQTHILGAAPVTRVGQGELPVEGGGGAPPTGPGSPNVPPNPRPGSHPPNAIGVPIEVFEGGEVNITRFCSDSQTIQSGVSPVITSLTLRLEVQEAGALSCTISDTEKLKAAIEAGV